MSKARKTAIEPTRQQDYPKWYQEVVKAADLAEGSAVRGCMVIKPWGYSIWENIQFILNKMIKETGHQNFYFPLFVPLSFLAKEAKHIDGFAKECAVVTHHRLEINENNELVPSGKLEEPLIVRPTSETIIGEAYSRWINSYRDLPLLGNQWANIVRWEMRPRIFLRTTEFLWQEGHTAHATKEEAIEETEKMLEVYRQLVEDYLAIPVILGRKTESEKFPGADITYCLEAMMQDKKALQAGTSHFLGQHFSKSFNIKYLSKEGKEEFTWTTSWGVTTRLIGGLIMTHGDDDGLVLPPKIAPIQVIIIPLVHKVENEEKILAFCNDLKAKIPSSISVEIDKSNKTSGEKIWGWIKKGVPIRLEIGIKEVEADTVFMGRRDLEPNDKKSIAVTSFLNESLDILENIQENILQKARSFLKDHSFQASSKEEFYQYFNKEEEQPGFISAYWIGDDETEQELKSSLKVTARCIPLSSLDKKDRCIFTGKENAALTIFARSY